MRTHTRASMTHVMGGLVLLAMGGALLASGLHADAQGATVPGTSALHQDGLPDTPAGRCLRAYLAAFNSGQEPAPAEFVRRHWPRASAGDASSRLGQERRLRDSWGTLTLVRVAQSSERVITCLMRPSASRDWLVFRIELTDEASPPAGGAPAIERFTRTGAEIPGGHETVPGDEARMLPGGVGFLRFEEFSPTPEARAAATATLAAVAECRALVLDLRENHGGWPEMMQFVAGHLFEERTLVGALYDREGRLAGEWWTPDSIPGRPVAASVPAYVLTSTGTASAAEGFARLLQRRGRAIVVGEKTRGASHPAREVAVNEYFMMSVPFLRGPAAEDREGVGVTPDHPVPADKALEETVRLLAGARSRAQEDQP